MKLSIPLFRATVTMGLLVSSVAAGDGGIPTLLRGLQEDETNSTDLILGAKSDDEGTRESACCDGKPQTLVFKFTRGNCAASNNDQGNKAYCSGIVGAGATRPIRLFNAEFTGAGDPVIRSFAANAEFEIKPEDSEFDSTTEIQVGGQELEIHTSCSQPLNLGNIFGALTLVDYGPRSDACAFCVNDAIGGNQDTGCTAFEPLCNGPPNEAGDACLTCIDDKPRGLKDSGCNEQCQLCDPLEGDSGTCKVCKNDRIRDVPDEGCSEERPVCLASLGDYGDECVICRANPSPFITNPPHEGCSRETPICDGGDLNNYIGTACFKCRRLPGFVLDPGCTDPEYPFCVAPDSGFGDCCASCINDNRFGGVDSGCTDESPFCIAKYHEGGNLCAPCVNDEADPTIPDSGCDADAPQCNGNFGEPGTACEIEVIDPPLNFAVSAHGNTDWHIDTAQEFLFGTDINGNPTAANHAPDAWTRTHMHIGDTNTNHFYYDQSLVANGDDTNMLSGIDRAMLFFYAGHGSPTRFDTLGNNALLTNMLIGNGADQSLRYYWQCACKVFAHGPRVCNPVTTFPYGCPADFTAGTADSVAMRNVYERWGPILGDNLRMACGGSTQMYCHEANVNRAWDNYNNNGMDVADSFIDGFSGSGVVPICIAIGGSTPNLSPLALDTVFTNAPNPGGGWFHIQYLGGADMVPIRRKLHSEDVPSTLPILSLSAQTPTQIWIEKATEEDGDLLVSIETVGDRGPRWIVNTKSGTMHARGESILTDKILSDEDYLANATSLVDVFGWSEDLKGDADVKKIWLDIIPREETITPATTQIQRALKRITISWPRFVEVSDTVPEAARIEENGDGIVPVLYGAGGGGGGVITIQLNNDGSLLNAAKVWRTIEGETLFPTKSYEAALAEAEDMVGDSIGNYTLDDWSWGYREEAGNVEQTKMTMYYIFEFKPTDPDTVLEFPPQIVEIIGIRQEFIE